MKTSAVANKFIVFKIADYLLALPVINVLKIVNCPPMNDEYSKSAGLVHIGQHTIMLLNLHQKLASRYNSQLNINPFLIIIQALQGEVCAIPVEEPPNLVELPKDSIRTLPKSYRQDALQDLVNYVAVLSEEEKKITIFILDVNKALSTTTNSNTPRLIAIEN